MGSLSHVLLRSKSHKQLYAADGWALDFSGDQASMLFDALPPIVNIPKVSTQAEAEHHPNRSRGHHDCRFHAIAFFQGHVWENRARLMKAVVSRKLAPIRSNSFRLYWALMPIAEITKRGCPSRSTMALETVLTPR